MLLFYGPTRVAFNLPELLAQARLTLPPIAQLAARLGWNTVLTLDDVVSQLVPHLHVVSN